jgi:hypothetical protein
MKIYSAGLRKIFALALVAFVLPSVQLAHGATTSVAAQGAGGNERCLIGTGGICSGGAYNNARSLVSIFESDLGSGYALSRVDDSFDKLWMNTVNNGGQIQALARYAGDNSTFGYNTGSGFSLLSNSITNSKVRVNSAAAFAGDNHAGDFVVAADSWTTIPVAASVPFAFVLNDPVIGFLSSNNPVGSFDNMVTFQVKFNGVGQQHYFLAFEDRGISSDKDYNDFVVEVRFTTPVPEPGTYAMFLAGLCMMGFIARRRTRNISSFA